MRLTKLEKLVQQITVRLIVTFSGYFHTTRLTYSKRSMCAFMCQNVQFASEHTYQNEQLTRLNIFNSPNATTQRVDIIGRKSQYRIGLHPFFPVGAEVYLSTLKQGDKHSRQLRPLGLRHGGSKQKIRTEARPYRYIMK
ncbi:hypothetical protein [Serratia marcescens]|uniref:hypothetical protein n=1 Tax=Serratia marcescens TaxID=615 RepID=UPI0012EB8494|nr:hypothetical protein [Serratia marcescens]